MRLTSRHLYLRPLKKSDAISIHLYASDETTTRYMLWGPNTYSETLNYVESSLRLVNDPERKIYRFAIILRHSDDLIGVIDITIKNTHIGELGYILNRSYWSLGYMSEAAKMMLHYAFDELGLQKVIATCDRHNIASARVMEKIGMHFVAAYRRYNPKLDDEMEGLLYEINRP